jgi:rhodanese-related sulfurtransferase
MARFAPVAVLALALLGTARAADPTTDTLDTVKKNLADGKAVIVDVRELAEWKGGHLKGAKHLPLSELKAGADAEKLKKLLPEKGAIYLHCAAGKRCLAAADILKKQGYDVRPLKDEFDALVKNGFPEEK